MVNPVFPALFTSPEVLFLGKKEQVFGDFIPFILFIF